MLRRLASLAALLLAALAAGAGALAQDGAGGDGAGQGGPRGIVAVADLEGAIGPASARHVEEAISAAAERSAEALVLRINTPGGLSSSMREIVTSILESPVPVIGYVAPPGGHAASAGLYVLQATHVAAMAPGTNTGSATPVQIGGGGLPLPGGGERPGGGEPGQEGEGDGGGAGGGEEAPQQAPADPMTAKAVNDAVAYVRGLAELRGRNADWVERAVREAASVSAQEAFELGVVEVVARDLSDLLSQVDGRTVEAGGVERTLATAGKVVERIEPSTVTEILRILSNPNVALILMLIGVYGLIFEFANPGLGPGIVGAICLLLGLYSLNQLPVDYAGLALMGLGIAFMIAEAVTPAFGVLGIGGLAAFTIGAAMLVDTDVPAYQVSWTTIAVTAGLSFAVLSLLLRFVWRAHLRPVKSGRAEMIGAPAEVLDWSGGRGHVWTHSERWEATGPAGLAPGQQVRVADLDGLRLVVAEDRPDTEQETPG
jgi:membrane-bound serine protease (ClpP class)